MSTDQPGSPVGATTGAFDSLFSHDGTAGSAPGQDQPTHAADKVRRHAPDEAGPGQPLEMRFSGDGD